MFLKTTPLHGIISTVALSALPDHSLLIWSIILETEICNIHVPTCAQSTNTSNFTKFDVSKVPIDFMLDPDTLNIVNQTILKIESGFHTQSELDAVYDDWCNILQRNMSKSLQSRIIRCGVNNKNHRPGKPWWSGKLTDLWNDMCLAKNAWLSCKEHSSKAILKYTYITKRNLFDREVQSSSQNNIMHFRPNSVARSSLRQ